MVSFGQRICLLAGILHQMEAVCEWRRFAKTALYGFNDKVIKGVEQSECESYCKQEKDFSCESFDYMANTRTCFLSQNSRHTQPGSFGKHDKSDYYEEECRDDDGSGEGSGDDGDIGCGSGWERHDNKCYQFFLHSNDTWSGAKSDCENKGAHLVVINSEGEFNFLTAKLASLMRGRYAWKQFWTAGKKSGSTWVWDTQGFVRHVNYVKWYSGEPNNSGNREDRITLIYGVGKWGFNDAYSEVERGRGHICEK